MVALLDVNVLIALSWGSHVFHDRVQRWFAKHAGSGWATCPFTEAAFVRILSNPRFSPHAVSPQQALDVLEASTQHATHKFWADEVSVADSVRPFRNSVVGHQQITDAYLLGLALRKNGKLSTLDHGILSFVQGSGMDRRHLEIIA